MNNRLDGVLVRNRKHRVLDLVGAAFLLFVMAFSVATFAAELPALSSRGAQPAAAETTEAVAQGGHLRSDARVAYR